MYVHFKVCFYLQKITYSYQSISVCSLHFSISLQIPIHLFGIPSASASVAKLILFLFHLERVILFVSSELRSKSTSELDIKRKVHEELLEQHIPLSPFCLIIHILIISSSRTLSYLSTLYLM